MDFWNEHIKTTNNGEDYACNSNVPKEPFIEINESLDECKYCRLSPTKTTPCLLTRFKFSYLRYKIKYCINNSEFSKFLIIFFTLITIVLKENRG